MHIEVSLASLDEKPILQNLMQFYLYEFSTIESIEIDEHTGNFSYPYLDRYWIDKERYPFLVRVNGKLAGFALVSGGSYFPQPDDRVEKSMIIAEFFVMSKFRRQGIGTRVAVDLFNRFPGRWEVSQESNNQNGHYFWRSVIGGYCQGNFEEVELDNEIWNGPVQVFDNTPSIQE
jgi:predicted acetyltransferase